MNDSKGAAGSGALSVDVEALADVHTHLREGDVVASLIAKAIIGGADVLGAMPNTTEGLTTAQLVLTYINRAEKLVPPGLRATFIPFVMITENTTKEDIEKCVELGILDAKIYPYMRTTKSQNGVVRYGRLLPIIQHSGSLGMRCHLHPEHPSMLFDNRDAEFAFLPIVRVYLEETDTFIIWEHGTDARCIPHWKDMAKSNRFAMTLTAHHLVTDEDKEFGAAGSVCKPPIKTARDCRDLVSLVAEDNAWVWAGGDSAFHDRSAKHVDGRCACGAYTGPFLLPLYAHALDSLMATPEGIRKFINFTSRNARRAHYLPASSRTVRLVREEWEIPSSYSIGSQTALPFWAGQKLHWKIA